MFGKTSFTKLALAAALATGISALPIQVRQAEPETFNIKVINSCAHDQPIGVFRINPDFSTSTLTPMTTIASGQSHNLTVPYKEIGLRIATNENQFTAQPLFEFGYSGWGDVEGTAYDLSMMSGLITGMKATPANPLCEAKQCDSLICKLASAWTNADQTADGSPADTVCYHGKTDFTVEYCPKN
ncbi:Hypothetical protein R9X50_00633200 [Acrodontium crateriforme]|uniref:Uncharacterized protein n=1 Tax=Acrodontium crateriforme TaxID=150365 RepID=A0AAQ3MD68_9PEZI|nr:Hypothetical protein R9X50_00633200 [Acrodontium crateriforme]